MSPSSTCIDKSTLHALEQPLEIFQSRVISISRDLLLPSSVLSILILPSPVWFPQELYVVFWSDSVAIVDSNSFSSLEEKRSHQTTESQSVPQHWLSQSCWCFQRLEGSGALE